MCRRALQLSWVSCAPCWALFFGMRNTWILGFGPTCLLTFGRRWLTGLLRLLLLDLWCALLLILMLMGRHVPGTGKSEGDQWKHHSDIMRKAPYVASHLSHQGVFSSNIQGWFIPSANELLFWLYYDNFSHHLPFVLLWVAIFFIFMWTLYLLVLPRINQKN